MVVCFHAKRTLFKKGSSPQESIYSQGEHFFFFFRADPFSDGRQTTYHILAAREYVCNSLNSSSPKNQNGYPANREDRNEPSHQDLLCWPLTF